MGPLAVLLDDTGRLMISTQRGILDIVQTSIIMNLPHQSVGTKLTQKPPVHRFQDLVQWSIWANKWNR